MGKIIKRFAEQAEYEYQASCKDLDPSTECAARIRLIDDKDSPETREEPHHRL